MGYPGKPTDDVMELVRKLHTLSVRRGSRAATGYDFKELDAQIETIIDQIHSEVSAMDTSGDDYARDMGF